MDWLKLILKTVGLILLLALLSVLVTVAYVAIAAR